MALMDTSFITKAVQKAGGRSAVAKKLNVNVETVRQWEIKKIPAERAVDLEKISGVHRSFLRPDLWGVTA
jgi:DNA-binding transcriptional regulator YdaS (Cro superfamily)